MKENRKEIIVNEILYWKNSKLLPEQYCNFLLALYTEGSQINDSKAGKSSPFWKVIWPYIPLLLIPGGIFIYFTELSFFLQTTLYSFVIFIGLGFSIYFIRKTTFSLISLISTALVILLCTVDLISTLIPNNQVSLYMVILINCIGWFILGKKANLLSFTVSSVLGIILVVVSIFIILNL